MSWRNKVSPTYAKPKRFTHSFLAKRSNQPGFLQTKISAMAIVVKTSPYEKTQI